jgi:DNA repair protein SbcC/Rad50
VRIVAIRCENLTSLVGPVAIELEEPPLRDLGIFTITGPTGSGKSTLLDAVCLALFGTAPRLEDQGRGVKVGREDEDPNMRLPLGDARTLVSRGAAYGMAEVEFIGKSGHRYVARWEARRARGRASARFQDAEMSLVDRDTKERLGRTKTDVLYAIERVLGLDMAQFRRSALLSQGDFAAFLASAGEERSLLLEQMTGTGIYTAISQAAHERAKAARDEVALCAAGMETVAALAPEALEALTGTISRLEGILKAQKDEALAVDAAVRFYDRRQELARLVAEAGAELEVERKGERDASGEREELERVERAAPLRPLLAAHREAERRHMDARQRLDEARSEQGRALEAVARAREATLVRQNAHATAEKAAAEAGPELATALRLDIAIEEASARLAAASESLDAAVRASGEAHADAARLDEPFASASSRRDDAVRWLDENAHVEPLAAQWPRWRELLDRWVAAHGAEEPVESASVARVCGTAALEALVARSAEAYVAAEEAAGAALFSAEDEVDRDATLERLARLETLGPLAAQIQSYKGQAESEAARARTLREHAAAEIDEAARLSNDAEREAGALGEAKHALESARLTVDLASHRSVLVAGEPCPLCGATAHPYADGTHPWNDLLDGQKRRVDDLESVLQSLRDRSAEHRVRAQGSQSGAGEAEARAESELARAAKEERSYLVAAETLGLGTLGTDASGVAVIDARRAFERSKRDRLRAREKEAGERAGDVVRVRRDLDRARAALERQKTKEALAPALSGQTGWQERLETGPCGLIEACERDVLRYKDCTEAREAADGEIARLEGLRAAALATIGERVRVVREKEEERGKLLDAAEARRLERGRVLGGRPTAGVRAALDSTLEATATALSQCREAEQTAAVAVAAAVAGLVAADADAARADAELGRIRAALQERTRALAVEASMLPALLDRDDAWIATTRERLSALGAAVRAAEAVLADRTRMRVAHEGAARPVLAEDEARSGLEPARAAVDQTSLQLTTALSERLHDERARAVLAERLAAREDAKKRSERWQLLDAVIGSRDGKVLRDFAQGLTLDALLEYANQHLLDLAPRYRLMRVPGHDMELQIVDRDMGDEVRGANTLSGGETFLVSLALALGLSSLAARDVRIETLFIDEGFGALDAATLDVAIASLYALQTTGRQVGIISHVGALADKIGAQVRVQRVGGGRSRVVLGR